MRLRCDNRLLVNGREGLRELADVVEVASGPVNVRELTLEVDAEPVDDPGTPPVVGLPVQDEPADLPVQAELSLPDSACCGDQLIASTEARTMLSPAG